MVEDEKDRLGKKLRDKEKGQEDEYFARRERELLQKMRERQEENENEKGEEKEKEKEKEKGEQ